MQLMFYISKQYCYYNDIFAFVNSFVASHNPLDAKYLR